MSSGNDFMVYRVHTTLNASGQVSEYVHPESFRTYEGADQYRHAQITQDGWVEDHFLEAWVEPVTNYMTGKQWGTRTYLRKVAE